MHFSTVRSHATGDVSAPRKSGFPLAGASANGPRWRRWQTNGLRVFISFVLSVFSFSVNWLIVCVYGSCRIFLYFKDLEILTHWLDFLIGWWASNWCPLSSNFFSFQEIDWLSNLNALWNFLYFKDSSVSSLSCGSRILPWVPDPWVFDHWLGVRQATIRLRTSTTALTFLDDFSQVCAIFIQKFELFRGA